VSPISWDQFKKRLWVDPHLGVSLDVSRMNLTDAYLTEMQPRFAAAFQEMDALEKGAIANPTEDRRVGHYWLRDAGRAPDPETRSAIETTQRNVKDFVLRVHQGRVKPPKTDRFGSYLLIGIGGSALGPQLLAHAFASPKDKLRPHFLDNTDPDGMDQILALLRNEIRHTLVIVVSKSGGTPETRNGMVEVQDLYRRLDLDFGAHAVAVTGRGSALEAVAREERFLESFPMWDWVGGRTSLFSAVGLLPAALQGIPVDDLLAGARAMDERTRRPDLDMNPAALLAAAWHRAGNGRGDRDMVVLPYRDRLLLLSRYLQQLVMESLGKEKDRQGNVVHQGLVVYGNKGSTDQHAFIQQLREGPDNFFATFVETLADRKTESPEVEDGVTSGDYLLGLLLGTRRAFEEAGHPSLTITLPEVSPRAMGMLIALFERAVGLYASLIGVNAYDQPGVEAGKRAAKAVLDLQRTALLHLYASPEKAWRVEELAQALGADVDTETLFKILEHAAANPDHGVARVPGVTRWDASYRADRRGNQRG
jgi:glucose-6-phosphate isomerase